MPETPRRPYDIDVSDCIDGAKAALEQDPGAQVIWDTRLGHAYVLPSGASADTETLSIPRKLRIAGREFPAPPAVFPTRTAKQLEGLIQKEEAINITNLIKRMFMGRRRK